MGETELKRALQREGEEQVRNFWQQAEDTVATRRKEIKASRIQLRAEIDCQMRTEAGVLRNNLLFEAQTRVMGCRLHAEAALEKRLRLLAQQLLPQLVEGDRANVWQALSGELPLAVWTSLKIHPADQKLANRDFPTTEIESESALGGGLIATNADGTIRIDNSLACRLMRAWPELLPRLMSELRKQVDNDETAQSDTTI